MNETIITWNVPNWITVVLMAAVGFAVVGLATRTLANARAKSNEGA